jgi:anthranilate synthase component 2
MMAMDDSDSSGRSLLIIDNYDSFVYNLVQYFGESGIPIIVRRNDQVTLSEIAKLNPAGIVISPGPGRPADAGISIPLIRETAGSIPILGVCLGHQAIGEAFGGRVSRAGRPIHGKTSVIVHDGRNIFGDLPSPLTVMRYHSLIVERSTLPDCLEISAWLEDGTIMGFRHRSLAVEGVQFHPESILSDCGKRLIGNFMRSLTALAV